jgi:hypothetical protein
MPLSKFPGLSFYRDPNDEDSAMANQPLMPPPILPPGLGQDEGVGQAGPQPAEVNLPTPDSLAALRTTPEELADVQDRADTRDLIGNVTHNLANRRSFGEYFLGHFNPETNSSFLKDQNKADRQKITDKEKLLAQKLEQPKQDFQMAALDKNSEVSENARASFKGLLGQIKSSGVLDKQPEALDALDRRANSMSAYEIEKLKNDPALKMMTDTIAKKQAIDAHAVQFAERQDQFNRKAQQQDTRIAQAERRLHNSDTGTALKLDAAAKSAADVLDKDPLMSQYSKQENQIDLDMHTLATTKKLSPQILEEVTSGIARAISGGSNAAVSVQDKQAFDSFALDFTKLQQKLTNQYQDINNPALRKDLNDILSRLKESYAKNKSLRANQLAGGRSYGVPSSQRAFEAKKAQYGAGDQAKAETTSAPKAGSVEVHDGKKWRFKGGDPANPKNWSEV